MKREKNSNDQDFMKIVLYINRYFEDFIIIKCGDLPVSKGI